MSINKDSNRPVYLQISFSIMNLIREGKFKRGRKLPGTRILAEKLGVHRRTLQLALDELLAQGWLEIFPRKGTFVTTDLPEVNPAENQKVVDNYPLATNFKINRSDTLPFPSSDFQQSGQLILTEGFPDVRLAPLSELSREIRSIEKRGAFKKYYQYGDPQGTFYFRDVLAAYLKETRALPITPNNLIITRGAQMGLYITTQVLIKPGDEVVVGDPGYLTATLTFQRAGANINKIDVDDDGIKVDEIEKLCRKKTVRAVYVISHHHQPTTVTLKPERRIRLLELAAGYNFAIIEDDYDYDFHYSSGPIVPMASLDQKGNVIYIGTMSKTIAPAIRIGFLVGPQNFINEAVATRRSIDFQGDSILEIAIAELFKNGTIANHIRKAVKVYHERRDHMCHLLSEKLGSYVSFKVPDGGLSIWTRFHDVDLVSVTQMASHYGLKLYDGQIYNTRQSKNFTRLGFSSLNIDEQDQAMLILLNCILKNRYL